MPVCELRHGDGPCSGAAPEIREEEAYETHCNSDPGPAPAGSLCRGAPGSRCPLGARSRRDAGGGRPVHSAGTGRAARTAGGGDACRAGGGPAAGALAGIFGRACRRRLRISKRDPGLLLHGAGRDLPEGGRGRGRPVSRPGGDLPHLLLRPRKRAIPLNHVLPGGCDAPGGVLPPRQLVS